MLRVGLLQAGPSWAWPLAVGQSGPSLRHISLIILGPAGYPGLVFFMIIIEFKDKGSIECL